MLYEQAAKAHCAALMADWIEQMLYTGASGPWQGKLCDCHLCWEYKARLKNGATIHFVDEA